MALTREDLLALSDLMDQKLAPIKEELKGEILSTRTEIMSYIESHVETGIHQIADGHKMLYEKMDREFKAVHEDIDELKGTQAAQEFVLTRRLKQG